ncbi:MAG: 50S ribosomal protein L23 [Candidatus Gracilibacteria bacterium]|nr:50S ribosomal protein L23 [Candidatus Gracilibacteria bacterium]
MELSKVIIKPLTTEKSVSMNALGKYVFAVDGKANKIEILRAVEQLYGTKPIQCRVLRVPEKSNSRRLKRREYNKAIVTFAKDSKFDPNKL